MASQTFKGDMSQGIPFPFQSYRNVNMVLHVHRKGGYGGGGRGRLYTYRYTVTTRMIPALRWAVMRVILMFQ